MEPSEDANERIEKLQDRVVAAKNAKRLTSRKTPSTINQLVLELQSVFVVLGRQLQDIEKAAEEKVSLHLNKHDCTDLEDWISQGQSFMKTQSCPFCGRNLTGVELITAYKSYFNEGYKNLKKDVADQETAITDALGTRIENEIKHEVKNNSMIVESWADQLVIDVPAFDDSAFKNALLDAREALLSLVKTKQTAPLETIGTIDSYEEIETAIATANGIIATYNDKTANAISEITKFKDEIATENIPSIEEEIEKIRASKRKRKGPVKRVCSGYQAVVHEKKRLEKEKKQVRKELDNLMRTTLSRYQESINAILLTFGAEFSIAQLSSHYKGRTGEPRMQYGLKIRNKDVQLCTDPDFSRSACFSTTLSESDKRTLALAFFLARLKDDPALNSKVVVMDDPVSSMDHNRRYQTKLRIAEISSECEQLIVLSHDAFFIQELRDYFKSRPGLDIPRVLGLKRVEDGYSAFCDCDVDDMCASDYFRNHQLVADFLEGTSSVDKRDVAKTIRPLLEGYLHSRFPRQIPRNKMFGAIINQHIATATTGPLVHLQKQITELQEINEYTSRYHHDSASSPVPIVDSELQHYASRALDMIYEHG